MARQDKQKPAAAKSRALQPGRPQLDLFGQRQDEGLLETIRNGKSRTRRGKERSRGNALFSNVPEIAWIKDMEGRFMSVSTGFAGACGVKNTDLLGKTDWEIWPLELAEKDAEQDRKVISSGQPDRAVFNFSLGTDGGRWSEIVKTPLFGAGGKVLGTLGIARDISAQRQAASHLRLMARQTIRAREDEKKRISSFLHDELGSLIMLLNSSLVLAQQELQDKKPDLAAARIEETKKAARDLAGRVRNICFDIRPPAMGVSGLAGAVSGLADRAQCCTAVKTECAIRLADEKKIDDLVKILVYRIIQESLNNAIKHSGASTVKIALGRAGGKLKFSVADDGKGFDAQDPGFLNRNPTLGLRIMQEEAESLYASLSVESTPGFGTVIKGSFPIKPLQAEEHYAD